MAKSLIFAVNPCSLLTQYNWTNDNKIFTSGIS